MKILLTGASGQLGQELLPLLRKLGQVTTVDRRVEVGVSTERLRQDLSDLNQVEILLNRLRPDMVINAAAYTAVDMAESDSTTAFRLNADLPGCLARWSQRNDRFLFHYSTDYVFDGSKNEPYQERDETGPINIYGESKRAGEWAIAASKSRHIILRTSWVYSAHGSNFVLSMLRLAKERPSLNIVNDQIGCPTWARNLAQSSADITTQLLKRKSDTERDGLYHYCDGTVISWHDFACTIFRLAMDLGMLNSLPETQGVDSSQYPQLAARPGFSVLDTSAITSAFGIESAGLEESLKTCLQEMQKNEEV